MQVDRIAVHDSVVAIFPPEPLCEALSDLDAEVVAIDDGDLDRIGEFDAVVTFAHRDAFLSVPWVHSIQAGYEHFPLEAFEESGTALTSSSGIHDTSVGETVTGYLLALARRLHVYAAHQERGEWYRPAWDEPFTVEGEPICVVGLGTLGRGIAERAAGLGMEVSGVRRTPEPVEGVARVHPPGELHDAISGARFVALAVPLTDETRHLIGADEFEAMRRDAYLVNVARGPVVDEAALAEAIRTGEIAGAALDVFEEEPLPPESPLWELDDVIITPHRAALDRDYYRDVEALVRESIERLAAGEDPANRVV